MRRTISTLMVLGALAGCGGGNGGGGAETTSDATPPTVTLTASSDTAFSGEQVALSASATDDVDGSITPTVACNGGTLDSLVLTTPDVTADTDIVCTATATDKAGNKGSANFTVTVKPSTAALGLIEGTASVTSGGIAVLVASDLPLDQQTYQGTIGGQAVTVVRSASNQLAFLVPDGVSGSQTLAIDVGGHHFTQTVTITAKPSISDPSTLVSGFLTDAVQSLDGEIAADSGSRSAAEIDVLKNYRTQVQQVLDNLDTVSASEMNGFATILVADGLASATGTTGIKTAGWPDFDPTACGSALNGFVSNNKKVAYLVALVAIGAYTSSVFPVLGPVVGGVALGTLVNRLGGQDGLLSQVGTVLNICFAETGSRLVSDTITSQGAFARPLSAQQSLGFLNGEAKSFRFVSEVQAGPSFIGEIGSNFATLAASIAKLPYVPDSLSALLPKLTTSREEIVDPKYVSLGTVSRSDISGALSRSGSDVVLKFAAGTNVPNGNVPFSFQLNRPGVDPVTEDAELVVDRPEADDAAVTVRQGTATSSTVQTRGAKTLQVVDSPAHGTVALNNDGSFTYTPSGQYFGDDKFTYRAHNDQGYSNVATVVISVVRQFDGAWAVNTVSTTTSESSTGLCPNESNSFTVTVSKNSETSYSTTYLGVELDLSMTSKDDPAGLTGTISGTYDDDPGKTTENLTVHIPNSTSLNGSSTWSYAGPNGSFCTGTTTVTGHRP